MWLIMSACPDNFVELTRFMLSREQLMAQLSSPMRVYGKQCSITTANDVRAIVPPSAFMKYLDCVLTRVLSQNIARLLQRIPGIFVGALRGTQTADIGHGCARHGKRP